MSQSSRLHDTASALLCRDWASSPVISPGAATGFFSARDCALRAGDGRISLHSAELLRPSKQALARKWHHRTRHGAAIDHIEFFGPPRHPHAAHGRNFVFCPGGAYDRSPCGTGTSAKLACLAAAGDLLPGEVWVQESIIGSRFRAQYKRGEDGQVIPSITGRAFVCGESSLHFDPDDPFVDGIPSALAQG